MGLPYFQSDNQAMSMLQTTWGAAINPVLANVLMQGQLLKGVALINGTTTINHKLGRAIQGWMLVAPKAAATVYQAATQTTPTLTLQLTSNAAVTTDIYVF